MSVDDAFRKIMKQQSMQDSASIAASALPETSSDIAVGAAVTATEEVQTSEAEKIVQPEDGAAVKPIDYGKIKHMESFVYKAIDTRSQVAEEYRILRTRLQIINPSKNSVMLTSCRHAEGKSSTSMNLALYLAKRREQKILLIDLDLRRPRLGKLFNLVQDPDLVDAVRGRAEVEDTINYSEKDNLYLMVTRREYSNATEILESPNMVEMMQRLHTSFDFIVIDTCPCLSTADPMVIGSMSGGALMIVRTRQTQRESLEHAIIELQEHGIPTLGIVLTFVKYFIPRYFHRYQYYHDTYYYYQRYGSKDASDG